MNETEESRERNGPEVYKNDETETWKNRDEVKHRLKSTDEDVMRGIKSGCSREDYYCTSRV